MDDPVPNREVGALERHILREHAGGSQVATAQVVGRGVARGRALHGAALRAAGRDTFEALARAGRRAMAPWHRASVERSARRQLAALDERLLMDIGLPRGRIGEMTHLLAAVRCPPSGDRYRAEVVRIDELEARRRCPDAPRADEAPRRAA